jgi:transcriptional regulator of acetoin/glycerol metabolism
VVKLPPLRERTDLETVVNKILTTDSGSKRYTVAPELMQLFLQHKWPGNFRQLTNLLRTGVVMAGDESEIGLQHMPDDFLDDMREVHAAVPAAGETAPAIGAIAAAAMPCTGARLEDMEQAMIVRTLEAHGGNVSATARALGVSRNTIYRKLPHLK